MRQTQPFDLILMDLQMPHMDGMEAARAIRAWEADTGTAAIPIIALSASVLAQDRIASDAAGMNGFAAKPLEPHQLMLEIARVLQRTPASTAAATPVPAELPLPLDGSVADWHTGMQLWGGQAALRAAWARFMAEQHNRMQELRTLVLHNDAATAAAIVHRMRGAAGNLALPQLHAVLTTLENAAHHHDAAAFDRQLPALGSALAQVEALLRATEASFSAAAHPSAFPTPPLSQAALAPAEVVQLQAALQAVAQSLQSGEIDSASLQRLDQWLPASQTAPLQAALDLFDLDQALHHVQLLLAALSAFDPRNIPDVAQP